VLPHYEFMDILTFDIFRYFNLISVLSFAFSYIVYSYTLDINSIFLYYLFSFHFLYLMLA